MKAMARHVLFGAAAAAALVGTGCASGADPLGPLDPLGLAELAPPAAVLPAPRPSAFRPDLPTAAEDDYLDTTIRAVFRRRPAERSRGFLADAAPDGYAVCARSRTAKGFDHALVVLQRRIVEGPVSQVEDDAVILRGGKDTRPCRSDAARLDWVPVG